MPRTDGQSSAAPWVIPSPPASPPAAEGQPASPATAETFTPGAAGSPAEVVPAETVTGRPIIRDTATLVIDGRAVLLAGIEGVGGAALSSFKDFVEAGGGTVTCLPAPGPYTYKCHLPDGSDLASIALLNGAARLGADAPADYRMQQDVARANHRGIWALNQQLQAQGVLACSSARRSPDFAGRGTHPVAAPAEILSSRPPPS